MTSNCGFPDGVVHQHVERCYRAGVRDGREQLAAEHASEHPADVELLGLAMFLEPALGRRLRQLIDATSRVHLVIDLEQRTQRAEDLAAECRRQLRARDRQADDRGQAVNDLAQELAGLNAQLGVGETNAIRIRDAAIGRARADRLAREERT